MNSLEVPDFFETLFKLAAQVLDVLASVCLDFFFHATDCGSSENSIDEKLYEVYFHFGLSWSTVSHGTGAASYKWLV